jgi:hypothetical protein
MTKMNIEQYFAECIQMDWFYDYSDDHSVWTRGNNRDRELSRIADGSPILEKIYSDFRYRYTRGEIERPQLTDYIEEIN